MEAYNWGGQGVQLIRTMMMMMFGCRNEFYNNFYDLHYLN